MGTDAQATVRTIPAGSKPAVTLLGWAVTFLDEPEDNGDAMMLFEGRTAGGGMIPPHREDNHEAFYIVEGTFQLEVEGEARWCEAGDFLSIQPGVLHSVRNVGPGWGRILFLVSPGSQHKRFFQTLGEPLEPGADPPPLTEPPDFEMIAEAGEANGIHFVPPPRPTAEPPAASA